MVRKLARLFVIKTRFEAFAVIYALAVGAVGRGLDYMSAFPGTPGYLLFGACLVVVFMGGAKILDAIRPARVERRRQQQSVADQATLPIFGGKS